MTYFCSDHHFWHARIILYCSRPFNDVAEMNEALVRYHNETVKPEDTVYFIGDFSMAFRPVELYGPRLNGTKYLVSGNHDFSFPSHKKCKQKGQEYWNEQYAKYGFTVLPLHHKLELKPGLEVLLSHLPYKGDGSPYGERFPQYRPKDEGLWLLCGHLHSKPETRLRGRMLDIGVDGNNYRPISADEVIKIIESSNEKQ